MDTSPERLVTIAQENNSIGIAYTYNEPLVWYEFVLDCAKEFRKAGLKNVLVSNGQINPEPLAELAPYIDAANIDLKAFNPEFYKSESGDFETTKNTIKALHKSGTHLELTNLVIPEKNDSYEEFENMCKFISEISRDIPLHISRYFPQHHLDIPPTTIKLLKDFYNIAEKYLNYVFIGNAREDGKSDTYCPNCKKKIIEREGYQISCETDKPICPDCSQQLSVYF
jgi:pyruvate formate lyase activating enzyme